VDVNVIKNINYKILFCNSDKVQLRIENIWRDIYQQITNIGDDFTCVYLA